MRPSGFSGPPPHPSPAELAGDLSLLEWHTPPLPQRPIRHTDLLPYHHGAWHVQTDLGPAADPSLPPETRRVDITNLDDVLAACEGMDAIINCAVSRTEPATAFPVSAYHVGLAGVTVPDGRSSMLGE